MGDQKDLYESWEPFRFASGARQVKGVVYDVRPNLEGGLYGVVRVPPPGLEQPWLVEHPTLAVSPVEMGQFIAEMLAGTIAGRSGPARTATIGGTDDWSMLIDHLLRTSLGSTYPLAKFWPKAMPRHFAGIVSYVPDGHGWHAFASSDRSIPPFGSDIGATDDPREGLPVLYISTAPIEDGKDRAGDVSTTA